MKTKNILVPWSGGLDSTYLVWKNLEQGNMVTALTVELKNNEGQIALETQAREKLLKYFELKYRDLIRHRKALSIEVERNPEYSATLIQPMIWSLAVSTFYASYDAVQFGYISGDCALGYLDEIKKLVRSYRPFVRDVAMKVEFPLIKLSKEEIYSLLPYELRKDISFCEAPTKNEPEGVWNACHPDSYHACHSCKRMYFDVPSSKYQYGGEADKEIAAQGTYALKEVSFDKESVNLRKKARVGKRVHSSKK